MGKMRRQKVKRGRKGITINVGRREEEGNDERKGGGGETKGRMDNGGEEV